MKTRKPLDQVGRISEVIEDQGIAKVEYRSWDLDFTDSEIREVYVSLALLERLGIEGENSWIRFRTNDVSSLIVEDAELMAEYRRS